MSLMVQAFAEDEAPARRLADALGAELALVALHAFPDGETLPTVPKPASTVLLYRSLDRPNPKLVPLLQAADALRRAGASRLVLVAPYLCYLRQDAVFASGQPLSRDVVLPLLGARFDRVVTVDPHLHRTGDLSAVLGTPATVVSAGEVLAEAVGGAGAPVVVGPDIESEPWAAAVAGPLGAPHLSLRKRRLGDREVVLDLPDGLSLAGRRVILVDDICSSGATLALATARMLEKGAATVEIAVTHALFDAATEARLRAAGAARIVSTDSCAHPTNAAPLAPRLAGALAQEAGRTVGPRPGGAHHESMSGGPP